VKHLSSYIETSEKTISSGERTLLFWYQSEYSITFLIELDSKVKPSCRIRAYSIKVESSIGLINQTDR